MDFRRVTLSGEEVRGEGIGKEKKNEEREGLTQQEKKPSEMR